MRERVHGELETFAIQALALPGVDAFTTPLGTVPIAADAVKKLMALSYVGANAEAHRLEHAVSDAVIVRMAATILAGWLAVEKFGLGLEGVFAAIAVGMATYGGLMAGLLLVAPWKARRQGRV